MNKIQYIKLLELRGVSELNGKTIAETVKNTGGNPTDAEMIKVNQKSMEHYISEALRLSETNIKLQDKNAKLEERSNWLSCLEAAGVDNWEGYDIAQDIRDES